MHVPWQILIASADVEDRRAMSNILANQGLEPIAASTIRECQEIMAQERVGLIFCSRALADGDYRDLLRAARGERRRTRIVVTTRLTDWDDYLAAMQLGAFDVISAPCRPTDVEWMIIQARRDEYARLRQFTLTRDASAAFQDAGVSNSA